MYRLTSLSALMLAVALSAACGDSETPTGPDAEPPAEITESFSGTLTVNGAATHPFGVQRAGDVIATLTSLSPDSASVISLTLGTWNGVSCQIIIANDNATQNSTVVGRANATGNFCVRVSDVGRLTGPTDYAISVRHF